MKALAAIGRQILNSATFLRQATRIPIPLKGAARDKWDSELSNRPLSKKHYTTGRNGNIVRIKPKREPGLSARQDKKIRKFRKRWVVNNRIWFGAEEAAKVGDRRI